jgi:hypothetical protein
MPITSVLDAQEGNQGSRRAHVCSHDRGASGQPLVTVHQNGASFGNGLVNEPACGGEVDEEVGIVNVFDWNPQLPDPASRDVGWDWVRADRHDMGDPPLRYGSRSTGGDHAIRGT